MLRYLSLSLLAILLVGCGEAQETTYDIDYYKTHEKERLDKLEWCKKSSERSALTNCLNASGAKSDLKVELMFGEGFKRTKIEK